MERPTNYTELVLLIALGVMVAAAVVLALETYVSGCRPGRLRNRVRRSVADRADRVGGHADHRYRAITVYLRGHYVSDVIAGWSLGVLVFTPLIAAAFLLDRRRFAQ